MWRSLPACAIAAVIVALASALPAAAQPADTAGQLVQGITALEEGRYTEAIRLLQQVVEQEPQNEPAWFHLGKARFSDGDFPGALEAFRRALELAPRRPGTRLFIGRIYEQQGALAEAIDVYQDEVQRSTGVSLAQARVALGRTYLKAELHDKAVVVLEQALEQERKYVEAMYALGMAQTRLQRFEEAARTFLAAKKILEDYTALVGRLGRLTPEQQRERKITEEQLAQDFHWAQEFARGLGLWPALNKALGDSYLEAREWTKARNAYRAALDRNQLGDPTDATVYAKLARAYLLDAREFFTAQGMLHNTIGILRAAEKDVDKALEYDPRLAEAYAVRGDLYAFQAATYDSDPDRQIVSHTYEEALEAYSQALEQDPEHLPAIMGMARVHLMVARNEMPGSAVARESLEKARGLVQQALALRPEAAEQYSLLAEVAVAEEKYPEALQHAERALSLQPDFAEALNAAGMAHYFSGQFGRAAEYFRKAIAQQSRNPQYHFNLGNTLFQMLSWDMARTAYREALKYTPAAALAKTAYQRAYIYYQISLTYYETRRYDAAIDSLNDALALDPAFFQAYLQLARCYMEDKQFRAAQKALSQAEARAATDADTARVKVLSGVVFEAEGDIHSAAAAYSAALALDAGNVLAQQALARLGGQQG